MDHTLKCETAYFFWKFIILEPRNFPRLHKIMFIELFMCIDLFHLFRASFSGTSFSYSLSKTRDGSFFFFFFSVAQYYNKTTCHLVLQLYLDKMVVVGPQISGMNTIFVTTTYHLIYQCHFKSQLIDFLSTSFHFRLKLGRTWTWTATLQS